MEYEDFELQLGPRFDQGFLVRVLRSPAGQAEGKLSLSSVPHGPSATLGVTRHLAPASDVAVSGADEPTLGEPSSRTPEEVGGRLFHALFTHHVGNLLHQSLSRITEQRGVRIRLRINPRDRSLAPLHGVPWELLYRDDTEDFLALSRFTPVVRALDIPRPLPPEPRVPPLRVLVVASQDPTARPLKIEQELRELGGGLRRNRDVEVELLKDPDSRALRGALSRAPYHVLHYIGHGAFDRASGEGTLLLHSPSTGRVAMSGRHLSTAIKDFASLRLVLLNACDTARSSAAADHNPFAGVATALVLGGVPAVVAMQSPILDRKAIAFSSAFYERLAAGLSIEEALTEGRQAIHALDPDGGDWAIPALFLRAPSGELFSRPGTSPTSPADRSRSGRHQLRRAAPLLLLAVGVATSYGALALFGRHRGPAVSGQPSPADEASAAAPDAAPSESAERPAETFTIGEAASGVRFEISTDPAPPPGFAATLRRAADHYLGPGSPVGKRHPTGWTVDLVVSGPTVSSFTQDGLSWRSCHLAATGHLSGHGRSADLGALRAMRTHAEADAACAAAATDLAQSIARQVAHDLSEEST